MLKTWGVGSPAKVPLDQLITARGTYEPLQRMRFDAHYPIVSGYGQKAAPGYYFHIADPLQFRQFSVSLAVSPYGVHGSERFHANVEYQTPNWKLTYWHNLADVYDLAGPVLRSRKGDAFIASYTKPLIYDPPRQLDVFGSAAAYFGLDQLPGAQNIASPKDLQSAEVGLRYTNTTKALGGVDHEKGFEARIVDRHRPGAGPFLSANCTAASISAPLCRGTTARCGCTPMPGMVGGQRLSPLAAYYFGAFRNNYVDDRPEKRYREMESFPGFEIDEIAARRFARVTGEVNLPPVRFAEVGTPAFYLSYIRPAVFAGAMATTAPDGSGPSLLRSRRAARPQLHRRAAPADGVLGRRGRRLGGRPLPQDRVARLAEDHVRCRSC